MYNKASRPAPLRDVQIAAQDDASRRYLVLDAHLPLSSPAYPFERQAREDHSPWQLSDSLLSTLPGVRGQPSAVFSSSTTNHCWNNSLDSQDDNRLDPFPSKPLRPYRSFTPPISPPVLSPPETDTEYSSGGTFALVPAEVDGMHAFTHALVDHQDSDAKVNSNPPRDGLLEDMQDILQQLDDLASWIKETSSTGHCVSNVRSTVHTTRLTGHPGTDVGGDSTRHLSDGSFLSKGKNRLPTGPPNGAGPTHRDLFEPSRDALPGNPSSIFSDADCHSGGFIYVPNRHTPEFLVGSSNSPIAYPVCGYSSHPSRCSPHAPGPTYDNPYHCRFFERRSAPCPPPSSPFVPPPLAKTSFKTLFHRSRCNTTAVSSPSIPSGHVPVKNALRQGKRMRLPWLRI